MLQRLKLGVLALVLAGIGCKSDPSETQNPEGTATQGTVPVAGDGTEPVTGPVEGGGTAPADGGAGGTAGGGTQNVTQDDPGRFLSPEISHSKGVAGGVVLLYPRIIPSSIADENRGLASEVQLHLKGTIERALPGRAVDVRPAPERVCPRGGCEGTSVNVLFSRNGPGCMVVALVGKAGESPLKLIPWAGVVELRSDLVPFREPPESQVTIKDYVPCDKLIQAMNDNESFVEAAIRSIGQ